MGLRETFLATLTDRFSGHDFRVGAPPDPLALFPASHPEVGDAAVWTPAILRSSIGEVIVVPVAIGDILADEFQNFDTHLPLPERAERITKDVVRFLEEVFADRLVFWRSMDADARRGWRERGETGSTEPLVSDDRTYTRCVWSGPLTTWRATAHILARGRIRDEREYDILSTRLGDEGPDGLRAAERDVAERLIAEYKRDLD
jgi:hypothetical protein